MKKTRGMLWAGSLALGMQFISVAAQAEESAATPPAPAAAVPAAPTAVSAPDIVRLKSGGMLRGTISEMVPNDYVVIVTVTGESKRFPMSEVTYAGQASAESQPATYPAPTPAPAPAPAAVNSDDDDEAKPEITVHAAAARLRLTSDPTAQTFHKRTSTAIAGNGQNGISADGFREMCTTPCDVSIASGTYSFGISKPGKAPVKADPVSVPAGESELHASYNDRSGIRLTGVVLIVAGSAAVLGSVLTTDFSEGFSTGAYIGMGAGVIGYAVGFAMVVVPDSATVEVRSGSGAANSERPSVAREGGRRVPSLTWSGTF